MKGYISSTTSVYVDENGIERLRTDSKNFVYKSDEEPFYNTFIKYIRWMYDINSTVSLKVLNYLLEIAEFNTGNVSLTSGDRVVLCKTLGIIPSVLSRSLKELIDRGVIVRTYMVDESTGERSEAKGKYMINPEMFWKGDLKQRKKLIVTFKAIYDESHGELCSDSE